jgi:hypothetical protein
MTEVCAAQSMQNYYQETFTTDIHINFSKFRGIFGISRVRGGACGCGTALQVVKVAGSIPNGVIGVFDLILPAALWPWGRLTL